MSAAPALKNALAFKIEILTGPHKGQSFSFDKPVITIGRGAENDLILENDPKTSRQHIEIRLVNNQLILTNLSQKNPVLIRGRRVDAQALEPGDKIHLGETDFILKFDSPAHAIAQPLVASPPPVPVSTNMIPRPQPGLTPAAQMPRPMGPPMGPPPFGGPPPSGYRPKRQPSEDLGRLKFYGILGAVVVGLFLFLTSGKKTAPIEQTIGPSPTIQEEIRKADETKKQLEDQRTRMQSLPARRAEENFIKGFRDFRQGNYARARESFQVVLTMEPSHEEARRYLTLAKLKFDEQVKRNLQQGRVYFENKNYRLCRSSFLGVMTMLSTTPNDPTFQEAKKLYELCDLAHQGGR